MIQAIMATASGNEAGCVLLGPLVGPLVPLRPSPHETRIAMDSRRLTQSPGAAGEPRKTMPSLGPS